MYFVRGIFKLDLFLVGKIFWVLLFIILFLVLSIKVVFSRYLLNENINKLMKIRNEECIFGI